MNIFKFELLHSLQLKKILLDNDVICQHKLALQSTPHVLSLSLFISKDLVAKYRLILIL